MSIFFIHKNLLSYFVKLKNRKSLTWNELFLFEVSARLCQWQTLKKLYNMDILHWVLHPTPRLQFPYIRSKSNSPFENPKKAFRPLSVTKDTTSLPSLPTPHHQTTIPDAPIFSPYQKSPRPHTLELFPHNFDKKISPSLFLFSAKKILSAQALDKDCNKGVDFYAGYIATLM